MAFQHNFSSFVAIRCSKIVTHFVRMPSCAVVRFHVGERAFVEAQCGRVDRLEMGLQSTGRYQFPAAKHGTTDVALSASMHL